MAPNDVKHGVGQRFIVWPTEDHNAVKPQEETMFSNYRKIIVPILIAILSLSIAGCSTAGAGSTDQLATLAVAGYGDASGAPDMVSIQLGIQEVNADVGEAVQSVNVVTDAIRNVLQELGVDEADVQTTNYSVWPEERYDSETGIPTGDRIYRVESTLRITLRDVSLLGNVIDQGLNAGANNVYGISFGMQDPSGLQAEARSDALLDARVRAEQLASELGLEIVDVLRVSEGVSSSGYAGSVLETAAGIGGGGASISSGELQVSVHVEVTYIVR